MSEAFVHKMFFKIDGLKNFAYFTGKHLPVLEFFVKLQAFRPAYLLKRDSSRRFVFVK